jgi:hypothetical protein
VLEHEDDGAREIRIAQMRRGNQELAGEGVHGIGSRTIARLQKRKKNGTRMNADLADVRG